MAYTQKQLNILKKYIDNTEETQVINYDDSYLDINNNNPDHYCIWLADDPNHIYLISKS